ncbi:MAG TPA: hypothetical protein VLQ68_03575 [Rhizobiaceae bacterium]|nr:hypothetical protein [Rhizobiaceae bacterium]
MNTIRTSAVAITAAIAMTAAASLGAATPAQAGNNGAAAFGGFVAGAIVGSALTRPVYGAPSYGVVYAAPRHCWWEKEFVGYTYNGKPLYEKVKVCN